MVSIDGNPRGQSLLSVIIISLILVPLSFGLRIWTRWHSTATAWWDDLLMTLALVRDMFETFEMPFEMPLEIAYRK